ncbi:hypothetical protein GWK08_12940 [Leptobacterium flavescens]|uniref:Lipoprotein n=1 Tax=Leptobacterium flavescens TaxID=472055 RepID=A0A6P0UPD7_9FLAO|nr:hypothetical protein [Leptobacterium flavescens]NER14352.1 hypothetical protein [Leptobacterium flavescens]
MKPKMYLLVLAAFLFSCQPDSIDDPLTSDLQNITAKGGNANLKNGNQKGNNENNEENNDDQSTSGGCNTIFANGDDGNATCFIDDGFRRWGWTIGPLSSGEYSFNIYGGAGQCDIEKGTLTGTLNLSYDEASGTATVEYLMEDGFVLKETHLYIGNSPYPTSKNGKETVAPGQYPYKHNDLNDLSRDSYTVEGLSGEIYLIAHGVACEGEATDQGDDNTDDDGNGGDTPPDDGEEPVCASCQGSVDSLKLQYLGQTAAEAVIIQQSNGAVVFQQTLQPFEEFEISGSFGENIQIMIENQLNATFITDCSQVIGPGVPDGSFVIISGTSTEGGVLCIEDIF